MKHLDCVLLLVRDQGVGGSNPLSPTNFSLFAVSDGLSVIDSNPEFSVVPKIVPTQSVQHIRNRILIPKNIPLRTSRLSCAPQSAPVSIHRNLIPRAALRKYGASRKSRKVGLGSFFSGFLCCFLIVDFSKCSLRLGQEGSFLRCLWYGNAVSFFPRRCMSAKKSDIACFIEVPARQLQHHLRCVFLASAEAITVEFEKQDSHHKSRALVAI